MHIPLPSIKHAMLDTYAFACSEEHASSEERRSTVGWVGDCVWRLPCGCCETESGWEVDMRGDELRGHMLLWQLVKELSWCAILWMYPTDCLTCDQPLRPVIILMSGKDNSCFSADLGQLRSIAAILYLNIKLPESRTSVCNRVELKTNWIRDAEYCEY